MQYIYNNPPSALTDEVRSQRIQVILTLTHDLEPYLQYSQNQSTT